MSIDWSDVVDLGVALARAALGKFLDTGEAPDPKEVVRVAHEAALAAGRTALMLRKNKEAANELQAKMQGLYEEIDRRVKNIMTPPAPEDRTVPPLEGIDMTILPPPTEK